MKCVCIVCKEKLENLMYEDDGIQPMSGLSFTTRGHYGSGLFDPMDGTSFIEIVVCDPCLSKALDDKIAYEGYTRTHTEVAYHAERVHTNPFRRDY